ncbi:MAG TPA: hypothetical protein VL358_06920 [Caulobacteraceae bacterium]|jgi:hypothetical protein|nr:hypothetical protein [Caulobacteraceae bacterium]
MPVFRYAVLMFGDEWKIVTAQRRIGHFRSRQLALQAGARLAREAASIGHEVELLVQDSFGGLLSQDVLQMAVYLDMMQGASASPLGEGPVQPGTRALEF